DEQNDVPAARRAGIAFGAGEEAGAEALRLVLFGHEQEPEIRGAIQRSSHDQPRESDDGAAIHRREDEISFAQRFGEARLRAERPRKESAPSVSTAHDSARLTCTMSVDRRFGTMCRKMMRARVAPTARAASTKSRALRARTGPRTTRMKIGVYTTAIAMITFLVSGPSAATIPSASRIAGNAKKTSMILP